MAKKKATSTTAQPASVSNVPIVAIGASAGGLEALVELLKNLSPTTGLAYVYIQHLDPSQETHLVDILSRATVMTVLEAEHQMRVEPNQLYIIPPDRDMEVADGILTLQLRPTRSSIHMPIDQFFLSLAERQREGAIAVILSGTASDGTLGLRAIKAAGGITFAQDDSARFLSMPRSAIAEGVVDRVLSPVEIARELERLSGQISLFQQTKVIENQENEHQGSFKEESVEGSNEDLRSIIQLLRRATGVDFSHYKVTTIRRRIIRRTLLYKLDSLRAYAEYLRQHPEEAMLLYDDLLINVTTFFRDTDTMDYIQKVLLPQLVREKASAEPIRIWVPACSTGQEAYSMAMLLLEVLGEYSLSRTIQLFATDLSESAVAKARLGSYTRGEVMDVSPRRLQRFFTKVDDHYRINKSVRDLCVFAPHNLLKDPPFSRLDLISCRNLLIYLDTPLQRKAIITFHYALNPNGYLVLGKSETVGTSAQLFSQLEKNYKVFTRRNDVDSRATFAMTPRQLDGENPARPISVPKIINPFNGEMGLRNVAFGLTTNSAFDLDKLVDNLLLSQYVPASVVVNQDMDILQFRGSTGLFLEPSPGKASLNLIRMARPTLVFELRNAIHKAHKSSETVRKSGLEFKVRNKTHYASIEAIPLDTATGERLFLIIFEEIEPPTTPVTQSTSARNKRIKELETELANLREDMRSIIEEQEASNEELQSANEEIISSNEELQSINEELETSKEEIESTNEELLTINQELQVRNDQLSEAHQFSEDIFRTIREATLILDTELRVKSANPAFYRLFQLTETATERRLIYELGNRQWDIPELRLMLTDIVTSGAQFQGFELTYSSPETGDKILSLNARRVVRQQDSILLAIDDITERRRSQELLAEREAWFHQIADNAPTLIWVTDADGHITFLNKVWLNYTGRSMKDVQEHGWVESLHPDDQAVYQVAYNRNIKVRQMFNSEYRLHRRDGEYRWMLENAQPLFSADGTFKGYIGSSADVHLQHEINQELDQRVQKRTEDVAKRTRQLSTLVENTPDVITRWDSNLRLLFANHAFVEKTGQSIGDLLGKTNAEMGMTDDIAGPYMAKLRYTFDTGQSQEHYNAFQTQSGLAQFYSRMVPEFGPDNTIESVLAIARDITDLQKAERELETTALNLQAVLNSSPAAIGFLKPIRDRNQIITDFQLVVCNAEFAAVADYTIEQLIGSTLAQLAEKLWQEQTLPNVRHVLETGEPFQEERYEPTADQWMLITLLKYDDGVVLTGRDISLLKKAEQQQEQLLTELEKSNESIQILERLRQQLRERSELLRSTSHDLRGNFGIIQGAASLLDFASSDDERRQMLVMLQRNIQQATQLITEMLNMARLEAGQEELHITSFDAAELLNELAESVRPLARERNLWLKVEGDECLMVESDSVKVRRIAQNLLLNALSYTNTGGVSISWKPEADRWLLIIADTGPGLPAPPHTKTGEGIGLIIVRQLCELLGGQMAIESQPNKGTRFLLWFPQRYGRD
ncbi:CheR family methyltransferase [Spirosoma aerolatum]|uniref:CheR family methyltransferase n=1 Tax=Spirosoma aerolatum TaxID=1211326 RepID=UPI0009AD825F|nr:chemotaxis protein CheB [Spirosoma aerolatum]